MISSFPKYLFVRFSPLVFSSLICCLGQINSDTISVFLLLQPSQYDAPFFTTWFSTTWTVLFFPLYVICQWTVSRCGSGNGVLRDSLQHFREKGFTAGKLLIERCNFLKNYSDFGLNETERKKYNCFHLKMGTAGSFLLFPPSSPLTPSNNFYFL